ncbi:MAG: ATPase, T2SS/T4P/T4SS family [Candidatus Hydrothermales bacterium]
MRKFAFIGTKGGVGTTTISSLLSYEISQKKKSVLLIEAENHGDLPYIFGFDSKKTFREALEVFKKEKKFKGEYIYSYSSFPSKFHMFFSKTGELWDKEYELISPFLKRIETDYEFVFFDCGHSLDEKTLNILDIVDLIFIIMKNDFLSIAQSKNFREIFRLRYYPPQKVEYIMNFFNESGISLEEIEKIIEREVLFVLPEDDSVNLVGELGFDTGKEKLTPAFKDKIKEVSAFILGDMKREDFLEKRKEVKRDFLSGIFRRKKKEEKEEKKEIVEEKKKEEVYYEAPEALILGEVPVEVKKLIHAHIIKEMTLSGELTATYESSSSREEIRKKVEKLIVEKLDEFNVPLPSQEVRKKFVEDMIKEILGLGPLEDLLADPNITEIMVNSFDRIYIEKGGKIYQTDRSFLNETQLRIVIERIVAPIGRRVDEASPLCDARLPDGSRVNITLPPVSIDSPTITIRKFRKEPFTYKDLINFGSITEFMVEFLKSCVFVKKNIIVAGGTGSGKTTLLNVLSSFIPDDERIVTIEDTAELRLQQPHVVRLEARPPNIEGKGEITIRDLVRNALRMRPDRIIVGECRGGEALDMLQAMNTGHEGSLTTIHANSPRDTLYRLETMVLMAGTELPVSAIRNYISSAIDFIVFVERMRDGKRRVTKISEITGLEGEVITMQDIFIFKQKGVTEKGEIIGTFMGTGIRPKVHEEFEIKGVKIDKNIYYIGREEKEW